MKSSEFLQRLYSEIGGNTLFNQFLLDTFGKQAKHFIGYKSAPNAGELPILCYDTANRIYENHSSNARSFTQNYAITFTINAPEIVDSYRYNGIFLLEDVGDEIVKILAQQPFNEAVINHLRLADRNRKQAHPLYEAAVLFEVLHTREGL